MCGNVAGSGNEYALTFDSIAVLFQHITKEENSPVSRGFRPHLGSTELQSLASQYANKSVCDAFVLAKHVADFSSSNTNVAGWNVSIFADVAVKFGDKRLAESHDLIVRLSFWVEISAAFGTAHGKSGETILECLFVT